MLGEGFWSGLRERAQQGGSSMAILFQTVISTTLGMRRRCKSCGQEQHVPFERRREVVRCQRCQSEIPPPSHRR